MVFNNCFANSLFEPFYNPQGGCLISPKAQLSFSLLVLFKKIEFICRFNWIY